MSPCAPDDYSMICSRRGVRQSNPANNTRVGVRGVCTKWEAVPTAPTLVTDDVGLLALYEGQHATVHMPCDAHERVATYGQAAGSSICPATPSRPNSNRPRTDVRWSEGREAYFNAQLLRFRAQGTPMRRLWMPQHHQQIVCGECATTTMCRTRWPLAYDMRAARAGTCR